MIAPVADTAAAMETALPDWRKARQPERSALLTAVAPLVVDLGSTIAFYALLAITDNPRLAAAVGMALAIAQLVVAKLRPRPVAPLRQASIALVLVVGTLTLMTNDPRIVLVKAALVYGIIGVSMLKRGWMLRYIPPIVATHLPERLLNQFERIWAVLLLSTGILNLGLILTTSPGRVAQVMGIWTIVSKLVLFAIQYAWCRAIARPAIKAQMAVGANVQCEA